MTRALPPDWLPRIEDLRREFLYEPETGRLVRRRTGREYSGPLIARKLERSTVSYGGQSLTIGRLAWTLFHGQWPPQHLLVDHINGDTYDNRISNLRLLTNSENIRNNHKRRAGKLKSQLLLKELGLDQT